MDSPPPVPSGRTFKVSRGGKIILELEGSAVFSALRTGQVLLTDHYWTAGMADWAVVGSRKDWDVLAEAASPAVPTAMPALQAQTRPAVSVKGKVLDYNIANSYGLISGDDGIRYNFVGAEWRTQGVMPVNGVRVEFLTSGASATAIYVVSGSSAGLSGGSSGSKSDDYYRSSDDKFVAGTCAGLAHKWGSPVWGVRLVFFFFCPLGIFLYLLSCLAWKERPTKS